jgi:class 3 adenylate cyclase/tetratricopeptide (TPR) repeat protein
VRGERKIVSILFVDLAGYTALSASLDPEDVYRFLRPGIRALQRIVESFGGTVPQIMGDGFMAVFGVPATHEDDAERAVRAALAVRAHVVALNAERSGVPFPEVHAGINSGEVMVAPADEAAGFAVIGDTVNTASRLADLASPGTILVDERTRASTRHTIRYGPKRSRRAKGKPHPLTTFEAVGTASASPSGRRPGANVFVDRRDAVDRVSSEVQAASATGTSRVLILTGEPGTGKSRLAIEIGRLGIGRVTSGRCAAFGSQLPLAVVAEALRGLLDLRPASGRQDVDAAGNRLARGLDRRERPALARGLRILLGVETPSPRSAGDMTAESIRTARRVFREYARREPLVVVLDDLHWADEGTLSFIRDLHRLPMEAPVVLLGLARHPVGLRLPAMNLDPLGDADMRELARAVAGADLPPEALVSALSRAAGNPLFLEETLGMLLESGAIGERGRELSVRNAEDLSAIPTTIRLLIAARLDGLPAPEKLLLQDAAVVGGPASVALLEALNPDRRVRSAIRGLERRGLLVPVADGLEVKHVLIRDVAYESLPRLERATRHLQIADHLRGPGRAGSPRPELATLARHYERAWELGHGVDSSLDQKVARLAVGYLGRWAREVFSYQARHAESLFERAITIARVSNGVVEARELADLLIDRAESLVEMGRHRDAEADATEGLAVGNRSRDAGLKSRALLVLGRAESDLGRSENARILLTRARRGFRAVGDRRGEAWALHRLSETWGGVDYRRELADARRAYELFALIRDRVGRSVVAQDLAYLLSPRGGPEFDTWFRRARRLAENDGDLRSQAQLLRTQGYLAFYRGCMLEAVSAMDDARPLAARSGDRYAEADAVLVHLFAVSAVGSTEEASTWVDELIKIARELGSSRLRVLALLAGARVSYRSGRPDEAGRRLATATRLVRERRMVVVGTEADATRAWIALDRGAFSDVAPMAVRAASAARLGGWDLWRPIDALLRGRAELGRGAYARAGRDLARASHVAARVGADGTETLARLLHAQCTVLLGRDVRLPRVGNPDPEQAALADEVRGIRAFHEGGFGDAALQFESAVTHWRRLGSTSWLARALGLRAAAERADDQPARARRSLKEASAVLQALRTPKRAWERLLDPLKAPTPRAR